MKAISRFFEGLKKNKGNSVIGLDLGTYSLKMVEIELKGNKPILRGFAQARTFETAIVNYLINDEALLTTNLKNLISNFKPLSNRVFLSLPFELTIYGKISISNPDTLKEIEMQINEEIPYKIEDVYYSYFIIPEKVGFTVHYLVSKKENIDKVDNILKKVNLSLENVDVDFVNIHNFLEFLYGAENKAVIDLGMEKAKIHFSNKDVPLYTRELFNLGIKQIKQKIVKELKVTTDMAERFLHNPPKDSRREKIREIYKEFIKNLVDEINFGIELVRSKYNFEPDVIYLIGGGARIPEINKILSSLLNLEVKEIDIKDKITISEHIDPKYLKTICTQGALALATGIKEFI